MNTRKNNRNRWLSAMLALLLLALPACGKDDPDNPDETKSSGETAQGDVQEKPEMLTHVFRGTNIEMPHYSLSRNVAPYYDAETGQITCLATEYTETEDENGEIQFGMVTHLLVLDTKTGVKEDRILDLGTDGYINSGVFQKDTLYFLQNIYDEKAQRVMYTVGKYAMADGTITRSENLAPLFSADDSDWFSIERIAVDGQGRMYLSAEQEILLLNENFVKITSLYSSSWISAMVTGADGVVYLSSYFDKGPGICAVDADAKKLGDVLYLGGGIDQIYFGAGYDLYYQDNDNLYGLTFKKEGETTAPDAPDTAEDPGYTTEVVMNFQNSNVTRDMLDILQVLDAGHVLALTGDVAFETNQLALFEKAPDVDLSEVQMLEVAAMDGPSQALANQMVTFNRTHPACRAILRDYSSYNNEENDWTGGETTMATDILTGLYKPDIVVLPYASELTAQMVEQDLFADLYPLIDKDERVHREDLLGAVTYSFDKNGQLWGLPDTIDVQTISAAKSVLGDRERWTTTELLDFAESLPEGTQLFEDLTRTNAPRQLLGSNGYGMFIDREQNKAKFDSPEFIRYLEFIAGLPETIDYAARPDDYWETSYLLYHTGKVVLKSVYINDPANWVRLAADFNTPDFTLIGFPVSSPEERPSRMRCQNTYMITSFCEDKEMAWEFMRDVAAPEITAENEWMFHGIPALKSSLRPTLENLKTCEFTVDFTGGMGWGPYDPENPTKPEDLNEPGYIAYFTEEDEEAFLDFMDNDVGASVLTDVHPEVVAIINEEISAMAAGTRSAADTAKIIQSRVSIWLAEHE